MDAHESVMELFKKVEGATLVQLYWLFHGVASSKKGSKVDETASMILEKMIDPLENPPDFSLCYEGNDEGLALVHPALELVAEQKWGPVLIAILHVLGVKEEAFRTRWCCAGTELIGKKNFVLFAEDGADLKDGVDLVVHVPDNDVTQSCKLAAFGGSNQAVLLCIDDNGLVAGRYSLFCKQNNQYMLKQKGQWVGRQLSVVDTVREAIVFRLTRKILVNGEEKFASADQKLSDLVQLDDGKVCINSTILVDKDTLCFALADRAVYVYERNANWVTTWPKWFMLQGDGLKCSISHQGLYVMCKQGENTCKFRMDCNGKFLDQEKDWVKTNAPFILEGYLDSSRTVRIFQSDETLWAFDIQALKLLDHGMPHSKNANVQVRIIAVKVDSVPEELVLRFGQEQFRCKLSSSDKSFDLTDADKVALKCSRIKVDSQESVFVGLNQDFIVEREDWKFSLYSPLNDSSRVSLSFMNGICTVKSEHLVQRSDLALRLEFSDNLVGGRLAGQPEDYQRLRANNQIRLPLRRVDNGQFEAELPCLPFMSADAKIVLEQDTTHSFVLRDKEALQSPQGYLLSPQCALGNCVFATDVAEYAVYAACPVTKRLYKLRPPSLQWYAVEGFPDFKEDPLLLCTQPNSKGVACVTSTAAYCHFPAINVSFNPEGAVALIWTEEHGIWLIGPLESGKLRGRNVGPDFKNSKEWVVKDGGPVLDQHHASRLSAACARNWIFVFGCLSNGCVIVLNQKNLDVFVRDGPARIDQDCKVYAAVFSGELHVFGRGFWASIKIENLISRDQVMWNYHEAIHGDQDVAAAILGDKEVYLISSFGTIIVAEAPLTCGSIEFRPEAIPRDLDKFYTDVVVRCFESTLPSEYCLEDAIAVFKCARFPGHVRAAAIKSVRGKLREQNVISFLQHAQGHMDLEQVALEFIRLHVTENMIRDGKTLMKFAECHLRVNIGPEDLSIALSPQWARRKIYAGNCSDFSHVWYTPNRLPSGLVYRGSGSRIRAVHPGLRIEWEVGYPHSLLKYGSFSDAICFSCMNSKEFLLMAKQDAPGSLLMFRMREERPGCLVCVEKGCPKIPEEYAIQSLSLCAYDQGSSMIYGIVTQSADRNSPFEVLVCPDSGNSRQWRKVGFEKRCPDSFCQLTSECAAAYCNERLFIIRPEAVVVLWKDVLSLLSWRPHPARFSPAANCVVNGSLLFLPSDAEKPEVIVSNLNSSFWKEKPLGKNAMVKSRSCMVICDGAATKILARNGNVLSFYPEEATVSMERFDLVLDRLQVQFVVKFGFSRTASEQYAGKVSRNVDRASVTVLLPKIEIDPLQVTLTDVAICWKYLQVGKLDCKDPGIFPQDGTWRLIPMHARGILCKSRHDEKESDALPMDNVESDALSKDNDTYCQPWHRLCRVLLLAHAIQAKSLCDIVANALQLELRMSSAAMIFVVAHLCEQKCLQEMARQVILGSQIDLRVTEFYAIIADNSLWGATEELHKTVAWNIISRLSWGLLKPSWFFEVKNDVVDTIARFKELSRPGKFVSNSCFPEFGGVRLKIFNDNDTEPGLIVGLVPKDNFYFTGLNDMHCGFNLLGEVKSSIDLLGEVGSSIASATKLWTKGPLEILVHRDESFAIKVFNSSGYDVLSLGQLKETSVRLAIMVTFDSPELKVSIMSDEQQQAALEPPLHEK